MTRISAGAATIATTGGRINVISGKERRAGSFPARSSRVKIKVDRDSGGNVVERLRQRRTELFGLNKRRNHAFNRRHARTLGEIAQRR